MSSPSPSIRLNKRKTSFEYLGQSAFYPNATCNLSLDTPLDTNTPLHQRRKSARLNKFRPATEVVAPEGPTPPVATPPSWPPGRITRALSSVDLVKIHPSVPPISRWQTMTNDKHSRMPTTFTTWVFPICTPSTSCSGTSPLSPLETGPYAISNSQTTPPKEEYQHSNMLRSRQQQWWTPEQLAFEDSSTDLPNFGHLALDSPTPEDNNALGLYTESPSIPLPALAQSQISRTAVPCETSASFDDLLMLLDSDIRSEIMDCRVSSSKLSFGQSLETWTTEELERELLSELDESDRTSRTVQPAYALRRGSTSELPEQDVLLDGRPLPSSYTMPALPHLDLSLSPDTSVEMPRSNTPSPIARSPTPSPILRFKHDDTSDLIDPYYLGEDTAHESPSIRPAKVDTQDVAEPEPRANTRRFWRDRLPDNSQRTPDPQTEASRASRMASLLEFIRDLPLVPDYDLDNVQEPWPQGSPSAERAEHRPEVEGNHFDRRSQEAAEPSAWAGKVRALNVEDEDAEHGDRYDDNNVSEDEYFPAPRRAKRGQSEPIYGGPNVGGDYWQPPSDTINSKFSQCARYWLEGRVLDPEFAMLYEILDELGSGGSGFVCTARDRESNIEVAVKFIAKYPISAHARGPVPIMMGDCPRECCILGNLNHPNIISYIDLFEDNSFFYMVTELHGDPWRRPRMYDQGCLEADAVIEELETAQIQTARRVQVGVASPSTSTPALSPSTSIASPFTPFERPGMLRRTSYDLFEAIDKNDFSERQSRHIFRQLVAAIHYLHSHRVYHRDLKDENIVMDQNFHVKIIDFGSAVYERIEDPPTYYTTFTGTRTYAPPEIRMHDNLPADEQYYLAGPADVWCLGIILALLLTGFGPGEVAQAAKERRFDQLSCSSGATDIIKACLQINPYDRATIDEIAVHPWLTDLDV